MAALLLHLIKRLPHLAFIRAIGQDRLVADEVAFAGFEQGLVESMPAECGSGFDDFVKSLTFRFTVSERFACPQVAAKYFGNEHSPAIDFADKALAHDITKGL